jgi:hypothetical protein
MQLGSVLNSQFKLYLPLHKLVFLPTLCPHTEGFFSSGDKHGPLATKTINVYRNNDLSKQG